MELDDFLDETARGALARPTAAAEGLPGAAYGEDFYDLEQRALFPKVWAAAAVGAQLSEAGDLLPVELASQPLLLVRGTDSAADPFYDEGRARMRETWKLVLDQDKDFVRQVQVNTAHRDRAGIATRFSPYWESAVQHFQRMVVNTIRSETS